MKTIFNIYDGSSEKWNNELKNFKNFSFFQTYEWGKYSEKDNWNVFRIKQFDEKNILISQSQILIKKKFGILNCLVPGGPVGDIEKWSKDIVDFLKNEFGLLLYIKFDARDKKSKPVSDKLNSFSWKKPIFKGSTEKRMEINLKYNLQELKSNLSTNWRHNLKRSKKYQLKFIINDNPNIKEIYDLYINMQKIKNLSDSVYFYSINNLLDMKKFIKNDLKFFECRNDKNQLISIRIVGIKHFKGFDILAATNSEGRKVYASYGVFWEIIKYFKLSKLKNYDLSGIDEINNKGVYNFKKGTGAELIFCQGEWEKSKIPLLCGFISFYQKINLRKK